MPQSAPVARASFYDRALAIALALALVASVALALHAASRILESPPIWNDQPLAWARVALLAALLFIFVVLRFPRHAAAATFVTAVLVAAALIGPGPVLCVALLVAAAYAAGSFVVAWVDERNNLPAAIVTLIGVALSIGVFEMTSRLRIHYAPVHAALALLVIALGFGHLRAAVMRMRSALVTTIGATKTERAWIVLAGVVATIHIVVAAKPEVGYDASTMHLQLAELIAAKHAFREGVDRYLWATMPLGAGYTFASAFMLGGEATARALNLTYGVIVCMLIRRFALSGATREFALAVTVLFASMPLWLLVTGSLFSETLWVALLMGTLVVTTRPTNKSWLPALALLAGGAMATKVISVVWLLPLAFFVAFAARKSMPPITRRTAFLIALGLTIGAWPYVVAWITTGNPVFPFMNALFRSPLVDSTTSFNNPLYNTALRPWTPWAIVLDSEHYIEGRDGALGLAWLLAMPLLIFHFVRRRPAPQWIALTVAVFFFVGVYTQQSYLRYLLPAFATMAALTGIALSDRFPSRVAGIIVLMAGIAAIAFNIRHVAAGNYVNATPCTQCLFDARARETYVTTYAALRTVAARLNRELPDARVGFMLPNEAAPAGYVGASRSGNWHDDAFFRGLVRAPSPEALLELARAHRLTHVVVRATPDAAVPAIAPFAQRYTDPLWQVGDYVVASVRSTAR
ncbi:MAG TPA: hypothetical protein VNG69_13160 [Casimicrobiaceae bacterium]|nr:hypothetical protein [Casimicrobiaceae bacterium]